MNKVIEALAKMSFLHKSNH